MSSAARAFKSQALRAIGRASLSDTEAIYSSATHQAAKSDPDFSAGFVMTLLMVGLVVAALFGDSLIAVESFWAIAQAALRGGCGGTVTGFRHDRSRCGGGGFETRCEVCVDGPVRGAQPKAGSARMCRSALANASTWG